MKHKNTCLERRGHPGINEVLQSKVRAEDFDVVAETTNLSFLGAHCRVNKDIPLMTCLQIVLALPYGNEENEFDYVECNGVVVIAEGALSETHVCSSYSIAIYFNEIEESEKEKIANFFKANRHKEIGI